MEAVSGGFRRRETAHRTTLVVADDHKIVREGLIRLLARRDDFIVVGQASNGEEAVDVILQHHPDVALIDINMPRLSGTDAIRRFTQRGSRTKALVLSMQESQACIAEARRAGASGYVVKRSASTDLIEAIDTVAAGACYYSPSISHHAAAAASPRGPKSKNGIARLSDEEREVLGYVSAGLSCGEIAEILDLPLTAVESLRTALMSKLGARENAGLVRYAVRAGLVEP